MTYLRRMVLLIESNLVFDQDSFTSAITRKKYMINYNINITCVEGGDIDREREVQSVRERQSEREGEE